MGKLSWGVATRSTQPCIRKLWSYRFTSGRSRIHIFIYHKIHSTQKERQKT